MTSSLGDLAGESVQTLPGDSMDDRLERNKGTVTAFYDLMFNQSRPGEAVERFVGATEALTGTA